MRRTRIVCTLGPASVSLPVLRKLVAAGMDVARLNFSHGDHEFHRQTVAAVRQVASAAGRHVALLQDLQGPKIRTVLGVPAVTLRRYGRVVVTTRQVTGSDQLIPVSHPELVQALRPRDRLVLADGQIELRVQRVDGQDAACVVVRGGVLQERKGVSVPGRTIDLPALTAKDLDDLRFGAALEFDYVALSFVRGPDDVNACRREMERLGWDVPLVAKLEKRAALTHLSQIIACCDGVMVARGDLGVELPLGEVPAVQKDIIDRSNRAGVPVITATEMLESMVTSTRPTRAEASDVANAIWDGTDAVMLSQETSVGMHPVEAVKAMAMICVAAESHPAYLRQRQPWIVPGSISSAMAHAAAEVAQEVKARAIVAFTETGGTALRVSKARPDVPVVVASPHPGVLRKAALYAGVAPLLVPSAENTDDMIAKGTAAARKSGLVRAGDRVVLVAGVPVGKPGQTNLVKVETIL